MAVLPVSQLAPLATVMLKVKLLNMGNPRSVLATALSPPNLDDIVRTVLLLKQVCGEKTQFTAKQSRAMTVLMD